MRLHCRSAPTRGLRRYVRLVALALGENVGRSMVNWEHPVDAYLTLRERLRWFPEREVALGWNADQGWTMFLTAHTRGCRTVLRFLGDDLLPTPSAVATFSARVFHDEFAGQAEPPPERTADDDRELTLRLAAYAVPHRDHRGSPSLQRVHLHGVITSWHDHA